MQALRMQNLQIQQQIENCLEQIDKQKEMNSQYENEIETLLKFNERLLSIIESEINTVSVPIKHKDNASLQPISERSERESDLVATPVQSFIRNRKIVARSERGGPTKNSLVELGHISGNKLNLFEKSEVDQSMQRVESLNNETVKSPNERKASAIVSPPNQDIRKQMQTELKEFQKHTAKSNQFYDEKIGELRKLSEKIGNFHPLDEFNKITKKVEISTETANLVRKAIMKNMM